MAFANPMKTYSYILEVDGIDQWAIQEVTRPEVSLGVATHSGGDRDIKTAGRRAVSNATLQQLVSMENSDYQNEIWLEEAVKLLPSAYKRNLIFKELATDGVTVINKYLWEGCFPVKISHNAAARNSNDNTIKSLELSVDNVIALPV